MSLVRWSPPTPRTPVVNDRTFLVDDVIGDAAAEIDDNRAEVLLVAAEHGLRGGVGAERVIFHLDCRAPSHSGSSFGVAWRGRRLDGNGR